MSKKSAGKPSVRGLEELYNAELERLQVDYSRARDAMFAATDTPGSPWWTVESNDKRSARLNSISHLLSSIPYQHLERERISIPDRPDADGYERPRIEQFRYVPDIAADLGREEEKAA